jgi:hypothetical protein
MNACIFPGERERKERERFPDLCLALLTTALRREVVRLLRSEERLEKERALVCGYSIYHISAYVSIRQHTSAYVSIRQHTSAYVSIRQRLEKEHALVCWYKGLSVSVLL